jgi:NADP-dependent 3-hydroxy acid dehydrogenase YdfG
MFGKAMGAKTLEGKVALVTGGSKGIGFSIATSLAREGASVVLVARNLEDLKKAHSALARDFGGDHLFVSADVGNATQIHDAVAHTVEHYGHLDILVNNAGSAPLDDIENIPPEKIEHTIRTNLLGILYLYHEIVPLFKKQSSGVIVEIISQAAYQVFNSNEVYGASKFGHRAASLSLEMSMPSGVSIYRLYPGRVATGIWEKDPSPLKEAIRHSPEPQLQPDQIGRYVVDILAGRELVDTHDILLRPLQGGSMEKKYLKKNEFL